MTGSFKAMAGSTSSPRSSFTQWRKLASNEMKSLRSRREPFVTAGSGASRSAKSASAEFHTGLRAKTTERIMTGILVIVIDG